MAISNLVGRRLFIGIAAVSLLALAGAAAAVATQTSNAQSPTPSPTATGPNTSNEDATHEKGETAEQEAAEDNGTAHHGRGGPNGGHGPNEDAAHEKGETAAQEAAEDAAKNAAPAAPTTPGSATPKTTTN